MQRLPRSVVNGFIVVTLALFCINAPPATSRVHRAVQRRVAPLLGAVGLDQHWQLYAPMPDHVNSQLSVRTTFDDGTIVTWDSPRWDRTSSAGRFFKMRHLSAWSSLVDNSYSDGWPVLAGYHARQAALAAGGHRVKRVELIRRLQVIPPPAPGASRQPLRRDADFGVEEVFYTRDY